VDKQCNFIAAGAYTQSFSGFLGTNMLNIFLQGCSHCGGHERRIPCVPLWSTSWMFILVSPFWCTLPSLQS